MKFRSLGLLALIWLALSGQMSFAADVSIVSNVDHAEITIGDRITYKIEIQFPLEGHIELPSVLGNLGSFEVKDYKNAEPRKEGDHRVQVWTFNLSTFTVGKYAIPPQEVKYFAGQDTSSKIYFTQPIEINVKRTSPETVKDIADIQDLISVENSKIGLYLLFGLLMTIVLGFGIWWKLRRNKNGVAMDKPRLPPFEEALEYLKNLRQEKLIAQNKSKNFCFQLSEVLRRYLDRRFASATLESTTSEFLQKLNSLPLTVLQKEWIARFCEKTDFVKFANAMLTEAEGEELLQQVEKFLQQTKPTETENKGNPENTPHSEGRA